MVRKIISAAAVLVSLAFLSIASPAMAHDWKHNRGGHWDNGRHLGWYKHGQHRGWERDAWRWNRSNNPPYRNYNPNYGYDRPSYNPYYQRNYNNPYSSYNNNYYNPSLPAGTDASTVGLRNSIAVQLGSARAQYNAAVARGDRDAAEHLGNAIRKQEGQLSALDGKLGYQGGYSGYGAYGSAYGSAPYGNNGGGLYNYGDLLGQFMNR